MMLSQHRCKVYIHNRPIDFESVPLTLISPIFGRLSDDLHIDHEKFLSQDFAPARNLANMLSKLENSEMLQKESFWTWLLETLLDIEREESSHDPHEEVWARLTTRIIKGECRDKSDFKNDVHVELGDNLLLVVEAKPEFGEERSNPHWQMMAYVQAYYMQMRCCHHVGQSPLPAVLIALYSMFVPLARYPPADVFQGHVSMHLGLSFVLMDLCKWKR